MTTTARTRKMIVGGAAAVGAVMLLSSSAYACTIFRGKMTVTGGGGSTSASGSGGTTGMSWCTAGKPADNAAAPAGGAHGADGSAITVTIGPGVCNTETPTSRSDYDINFYNGKAFTYSISSTTGKRVYSNWLVDCMSPRLSGVANLGFGGAYTNGTTKSWTVPLPSVTSANLSGQASAVCFSDPGGANGNEVPIIITA